MKRKAVFLDRDGVINRAIVRMGKPFPPNSLSEFVYLPDVLDSIKRLKKAGYLIFVVTNQPDVGKGSQKRSVVESMHKKLTNDLNVDDIRVCYHIDEEGCSCRKPKPGMIFDIATKWQIDLSVSFMIGDRWRDVKAGKAAGCFSYFIDYGYQENLLVYPDCIVGSLAEATNKILLNYDNSGVKF